MAMRSTGSLVRPRIDSIVRDFRPNEKSKRDFRLQRSQGLPNRHSPPISGTLPRPTFQAPLSPPRKISSTFWHRRGTAVTRLALAGSKGEQNLPNEHPNGLRCSILLVGNSEKRCNINGGRTRTRTLDPLIKSHQVS